jgi:DNA-binding transcriptional MocR family regulator
MSEEKKYEEIVRYVLEQMDNGTWGPGTQLPSVRKVADYKGCSVNSVIRAFDKLKLEGLLYAKPKVGYFVMSSPPDESVQTTKAVIDFSGASPEEAAMPHRQFQDCMNKAIFRKKGALFEYGDPQGLPTLRELLARHLRRDQIYTKAERIFITAGAQQALYLLAVMPFPNGKGNVLVEQPTYHGMLRTLALAGVPTIGIRRTAEGIDLEELERHFRSNQIKFFYTVPRYHNPMGWSYSKTQREEMVRLAKKHDVFILEDDYLADLEMKSKADPMAALDEGHRVMYVKSFSKVMLPGLRLALAMIPEPLTAAFRAHKSCVDLSTSALSQNALELFIENGLYDHHAGLMRERYRRRMETLRNVCWEKLPDTVGIEIPDGGIFGALRLPNHLPAAELVRTLQAQGVKTVGGIPFFLEGFPSESLVRLSIIRTDEDQIAEGIDRLAAQAKRLLRTRIAERGTVHKEVLL